MEIDNDIDNSNFNYYVVKILTGTVNLFKPSFFKY